MYLYPDILAAFTKLYLEGQGGFEKDGVEAVAKSLGSADIAA
jgi:hypothetical protein